MGLELVTAITFLITTAPFLNVAFEAEKDRWKEERVISDITNSAISNFNFSEMNLSEIGQSLKVSPLVYYKSEEKLENFGENVFAKILDLERVLVEVLEMKDRDGKMQPGILLGFPHYNFFKHSLAFLYNKKESNVSHLIIAESKKSTFGIVFLWDDTKTCDDYLAEKRNEFSRLSRFWSLVAILNEPDLSPGTQVGYGYRRQDIGCSFVIGELRLADFFLLRIDFVAGLHLPESYGLFRTHMSSIVDKNSVFIGNVASKPKPIYHLRMVHNNYEDEFSENVNEKYYKLFYKFATTWSFELDQRIVIQNLDESHKTKNDNLSNTSNSDNKSTLILQYALPNFVTVDDCLDVLRETQGLISGTHFDTISIEIDHWIRMLHCTKTGGRSRHPLLLRNNTKTQQPQKDLHVLLHVNWPRPGFLPSDYSLESNLSVYLSEEDRLAVLNQSPHLTIILREDYIYYMAENGTRAFEVSYFMEKWYSPKVSFGCSQYLFGLLENLKLRSFTDICLSLIPAIGTVLWHVDVDLGTGVESSFAYDDYYVDKIQVNLYLLLRERRRLQKIHSGDKKFILQINGESDLASAVEQAGSGLYCDSAAMQLNEFYEALVKWAEIHEFPTILKMIADTDKLATTVRWWSYMNQPNGLRLPPIEERFVMRHYPESMGGKKFPLSPCVNWTRKENIQKNSFEEGSPVVVTLRRDVDGRKLTEKEMEMMLKFTLNKFKLVEIQFGEGALKEDFPQFAELLQKVRLKLGRRVEETEFFLQIDLSKLSESSCETRVETLKGLLRPKAEFSLKGIHISRWNGSACLNQLVHLMSTTFPPIPIGFEVPNCVNYLNTMSLVNDPLLEKVQYLICEEEDGILPSNENRKRLGDYLDGHLVIQKYFKRFFPNLLQVYFRMKPLYTSYERKNVQDFLRFNNDVIQFSKAYGLKYILFQVVDDPKSNQSGWWRISNYSDLGNSSVYFEKESEYLNGSTWRPPPEIESNPVQWIVIGLASALLAITFVAGNLAVRLRRNEKFLSKSEVREFLEGRQMILQNIGVNEGEDGQPMYLRLKFEKKFEIMKEEFKFDTSGYLGSGNFGVVYKCLVSGRQAAVKVPNESCSKETFKSLLNEVKILCYVGCHENVLEFIGAYTGEIEEGKIYIATELCDGGSLQDFLRKRKGEAGGIGEVKVDVRELVQFSREIAAGMDFISKKHIVHGDLSTRNVLLDSNLCCKVGDFGLSRKLYSYQQYVKKTQEALPWKWLSFESLTRMEFTTKSDVWSYGITIWELFSLGDIPYPGLSWSHNFTQELQAGFRMGKPEHSCDDIYGKMLSCWNLEPNARPDFKDLVEFFAQICNQEYMVLTEVESGSGLGYVNVN